MPPTLTAKTFDRCAQRGNLYLSNHFLKAALGTRDALPPALGTRDADEVAVHAPHALHVVPRAVARLVVVFGEP